MLGIEEEHEAPLVAGVFGEERMYSRRVRRILYLLLVMVGMDFVGLTGDAAQQQFTVTDDIGMVKFGDPYTGQADSITFSPDGSYFVVDTERGLLDQDRPESTLRLYYTEDVRQFLLRSGMRREPSPIWMISKSTYKDGPIIANIRWLVDSSGVVFLGKTETGWNQLFLADLKTREVSTLTEADQNVTSFDVRDRTHFVYSVQNPAMRKKAIEESQTVSVVGTARSLPSLLFPTDFLKWHDLSELWLVADGRRFPVKDKSTGRTMPLYHEGQLTLKLSPDGHSVVTALAVSTVPPEWATQYLPSLSSLPYQIRPGQQDLQAFEGYRYVSEFVLIDALSGEVKRLTDAPSGWSAAWDSEEDVDWSADGKSVAILNTFLSPSLQGSGELPRRPCVAVFDLGMSRVSCLEHLKGKAQTKSGYEEGYRYFHRVHFARGSSERVTVDYWEPNTPDASTGNMSKGSAIYTHSHEGGWTVAATTNGWTGEDRAIELEVKESFTDPPVLVATDKTTKTSRVILDPNPQLKDVDLGEASVYKWKDKTGRDWVGGLYKPPDYVRGRRYPLVVQTHGFFETLFRPDGLYPTGFAARELAAAEILVLQVPDCPYTVDPEEGPCNVAVYEAGARQLVKDGLVDADRIGIIGFSRSCYYVLEALTTSTLHFKAASITDGINYGYLQYITNVDSDGNILAHEWNGVVGASPFGEGLQQSFKRSPTFNMDKVKTPLQLVANGRLGLLFMWEPYAALRFLNRPVDMVMLRQGTHVLTNPAERMASQGGTVDWFRFWLQGYEDPDPAKAAKYTRWRDLLKLQNASGKPEASGR